MLGWTASIALMIAWTKVPEASVTMLYASGLFAIAGSIGYGLNRIASRKD